MLKSQRRRIKDSKRRLTTLVKEREDEKLWDLRLNITRTRCKETDSKYYYGDTSKIKC
jgi:hypothetical protein